MADLKHLLDNIKIQQKAVKQLEASIANLDDNLNSVIDGLGGSDKQKIQTLKAYVHKIITKAKKGESHTEEIEKVKEIFKNDIDNGGKSS